MARIKTAPIPRHTSTPVDGRRRVINHHHTRTARPNTSTTRPNTSTKIPNTSTTRPEETANTKNSSIHNPADTTPLSSIQGSLPIVAKQRVGR